MTSMWLLFLHVIALYRNHPRVVWSIYLLYFSCHTAIGIALTVGLVRITRE